MRPHAKIAIAVAALCMGAAPALAVASSPGNSANAPGHNGTHGTANTNPTTPTGTSTPTAPTTPPNAFGKLCQGQSKKHVAGTPGTPFSQCVTALAKLANGSTTNPRAACSKLSKKHVKGTPGTPFSKCVAAAAKLHEDEEHGH